MDYNDLYQKLMTDLKPSTPSEDGEGQDPAGDGAEDTEGADGAPPAEGDENENEKAQ